jgi:hypothetical protein
MVSTWKTLPLVRRDGAYRESIVERRRSVHEVGRISNAEIPGNCAAHSEICLDGVILPGWKPEFDPRQVHADCDDVAKVLDALQITGIMPAEVAVSGAMDKCGDRVYPAGMSETSEAFLHCCLDVRERISATQGVTMEANRFRKLLQETAETAAICRKRVPVAWHLAGVA